MIQIDGAKTAFLPGEILQGSVSWEASRPVRSAELRLFWFTSGRGTTDVTIVEIQPLQPAPIADPIPFTFTLPAGPHSFAGTLITLTWAIELVFKPGSRAERVEFSISPDGKPIALTAVEGISEGLLRA